MKVFTMHASVAALRGRTADSRGQDNRFIGDCQNGDPDAWEELVKRHTGRVYGLCYRFTRNHGDAQDLTQEVFIRVFRTLATFRAEEFSFVAWLNTVTRHLLVDHYRSARQDRCTVSIHEQRDRLRDLRSAQRPDNAALVQEAGDIMLSALTRLAPDLREIAVLYDVQEFTYQEISALLGIPMGTVKSRLNRARTMLAHFLRGYKLAA